MLALLVTLSTTAGADAQLVTEEAGALRRLNVAFSAFQPTAARRSAWDTATQFPESFDGRHNGITAVTTIVERLDCDDAGEMYRKEQLVLVLVVERPTGSSYWTSSPPASRNCNDERDRWDIIDRHDSLIGGSEPVDGGSVSPDAPVLHLGYGATWDRYDQRSRVVIDARVSPPVLVAVLTSSRNDHYCAENWPTSVSCEWDDSRGDLACTERFDNAVRRSWLATGELLPGTSASTAAVTAAAWLGAAMAKRRPVGSDGYTSDLGLVRVIAQIPSRRRGEQVYLLGADDAVGKPFFLATRSARGTSVEAAIVTTLPERPLDSSDRPSLENYVSAGTPPTFRVRTLRVSSGGVRLLQVTASTPRTTTLWHLGIEQTSAGVVAQAILLATSGGWAPSELLDATEAVDACDPELGGFARTRQVAASPLTIDYDVEPTFKIRNDLGPTREDETCAVGARATWRPGAGFDITPDNAACSNNRFRLVVVRPNGSLEVHTRMRPEKAPRPQ